MQIRADSTPLSRVRERAALVLAAKGKDPTPVLRQAGRTFAASFALLAKRSAFTGAAGQVLVLHDRPGARIETVVVAGTGDASSGRDGLRSAVADGAKAARDAGADGVAVVLPPMGGVSKAEVAETAVEGLRLGLYVFEAYKAEKT
jgi:leucyl aminopeptidase